MHSSLRPTRGRRPTQYPVHGQRGIVEAHVVLCDLFLVLSSWTPLEPLCRRKEHHQTRFAINSAKPYTGPGEAPVLRSSHIC